MARAVVCAALSALVDAETHSCESVGPSGAKYQVTVQVFWDARPHGNIRVLGGVDDGGWRAFLPLTESFILAPDGSFVGE